MNTSSAVSASAKTFAMFTRTFGSAVARSRQFPVSKAQHSIQSSVYNNSTNSANNANTRFDFQAQREAQQYWIDIARNQQLKANTRVELNKKL